MDKTTFNSMIRRVLNEELLTKRIPEQGDKEAEKKKNKVFPTDPNSRDTKTKFELFDEIEKAVKSMNDSYVVTWNDHDDIVVDGKDMVNVCITPNWEDNYRIIFMSRNETRVYFNNLTWELVMEFIKGNLDQKHHHTGVEKARDKSWRNADEDSDDKDLPQFKQDKKELPQKDKPKILPFTNEAPSEKKNKEKNYTEQAVKNEDDLPNKQMKPVEDFKKLSDYKSNKPQKPKKHRDNPALIKKQK